MGHPCVPATILVGFAFGAAATAGVTWMRTWQDLDLVTLITIPLFLFSATFYPLEVYPPIFQVLTGSLRCTTRWC